MNRKITKILSLLLCILLASGSLSIIAGAADTPGGEIGETGLMWAFDNGTLTISGNGAMPEAMASDYICTLFEYTPENNVVPPWGEYTDEITSVVFGEGVTTVSDFAFTFVDTLRSVSFPSTLKSIGQYAFAYDAMLEEAIIPEGVETIGYVAFAVCLRLKRISVPSTITSDCQKAFLEIYGLEELTINSTEFVSFDFDTVINFGSTENAEAYSMYYELMLRQETFHPELSEEEANNFIFTEYNRRMGTDFGSADEFMAYMEEIENSVTDSSPDYLVIRVREESAAHEECKRRFLKHYTGEVPCDCFEYSGQCGQSAFWSFDTATGVLTLSGEGPLWANTKPGYCALGSAIGSIVYAQGSAITELYSSDFSGLYPETFMIPASVSYVETWLLNCNYKLSEITVEEGNEKYYAADGVLFDKEYNTLIVYPSAKADSTYCVPADCTSVDANAICNNSKLENLVFTGNTFFAENSINLNNLKTITLSDSFTSDFRLIYAPALTEVCVEEGNPAYIAVDGILFSKDMKTVFFYPRGKAAADYVIPDSVETIHSDAFSFSSFSTLTVPESVKKIENDSFFNTAGNIIFKGKSAELPEILSARFIYSDDETPQTVYVYPGSAIDNHILNQSDSVSEIALRYMEDREIVSVEIETPATHTEFLAGCTFTAEGLVLRVNFADGTSALRGAGYSVVCDISNTGTATATVDYNGYTVSYEVTVSEYVKPVFTAPGEYTVPLINRRNAYFDFIPEQAGNYTVRMNYINGSYNIPYANSIQLGDERHFDAGEIQNCYCYVEKAGGFATVTITCCHIFGEPAVTESTCTENGSAVYTCLTCGFTKTITLPCAHPSFDEDGNCTECGQKWDYTVEYEKEITISVHSGDELFIKTDMSGVPEGRNSVVLHNTGYYYGVSYYLITPDYNGYPNNLYDNLWLSVGNTQGIEIKCSQDCEITLSLEHFHETVFDSTIRAATCYNENIDRFICTICGETELHYGVRIRHKDTDGDGLCDMCGQVITVIAENEETLIPVKGSTKAGAVFTPMHSGVYALNLIGDSDDFSYVSLYSSDNESSLTVIYENNPGKYYLTKGQTYYFEFYDPYLPVYDEAPVVVSFTTESPHSVTEYEGKAPSCSEEGYTESAYCNTCNEWIVEKETLQKTAHTPKAAVIENEVAATCTKKGSYDEVVYCEECGAEISRVNRQTEMLDHTPKAAVIENEVAASCTKKGSYDEVVYCEECGAEISRVNRQTEMLDHTPKSAVIENEVPATCTKKGSYDEVVYCEECGTEISRVNRQTEMLDHTPKAAVIENEVPASCTKEGSYDETVYCEGCGAELSRTAKTVGKKAHSYSCENIPATCTEAGARIYTCADCGDTYSEAIIPAGHADADGNGFCDNCGADLGTAGPECDHLCHKDGFLGFMWKIINFFNKLFRINPTCSCGAAHY